MAEPTEPNVRVTFETFLDGWLVRQQTFLEQLRSSLSAPSDNVTKVEEQHRHLIGQVLSHYQQYYEEKGKAAAQDVILLFSPPWLSSLERTMLWIAGFKPSLVFRLVDISGPRVDLSADQAERMERVRVDTRREERELTEAMARLQENMAAPPLLDLARRVGRLVNGEVTSVLDSVMGALKMSMLMLLESADALRGNTVRKVVDILSPAQTVRLLAAAAQFQLQLRRSGLEKDSQRGTTNLA
ncbi:hypothetical protein L1049_026095 [Liquidambar formosana]|uniref:DOG1 domain-containing protein n=1 Tax=Liquidambar formosana TaxID=63359 RepID=A0AAP0NGA6_LIQFO